MLFILIAAQHQLQLNDFFYSCVNFREFFKGPTYKLLVISFLKTKCNSPIAQKQSL